MFQDITVRIYHMLSTVSLLFFCIGFLLALLLFIVDITQTSHAIRRNYPLIGRFRSLFEHLHHP